LISSLRLLSALDPLTRGVQEHVCAEKMFPPDRGMMFMTGPADVACRQAATTVIATLVGA